MLLVVVTQLKVSSVVTKYLIDNSPTYFFFYFAHHFLCQSGELLNWEMSCNPGTILKAAGKKLVFIQIFRRKRSFTKITLRYYGEGRCFILLTP